MSCQSCQKRTKRSEDEKKKLITRINRISGQMSGIRKMVEEDRYCDDILIQLSAIDKAIRSLSGILLESHLHRCIVEQIKEENYEVVDEVVDLFKRFQ